MTKPAQAPAPWLPAQYDVADAGAIQALARGEATPEQQQRALNWIINEACDTYGLEYRQDARDHAFASGKRAVGLNLVKMLKLNLALFRK